MQKGRPVTAGSKILENFISPIDATIVERLEAAGVKILGKTKMDEFGIAGLFPGDRADSYGGEGGLDCTATDGGVAGGSAAVASGAVGAVAEGAADFAFCNDYTGSVRRQAAERGLCYIHPTYGTVSRYGLIPAVPSMDQIGVVCKTPEAGFDALCLIAGDDPKDGAMLGDGLRLDERGKLIEERGKIRIGFPSNVSSKTGVRSAVGGFVKDYEIVDFELMYFDVYAQVMRILCCAELCGCLTRYDGIKFGYRASGFRDLHELYTKSRTEALGSDVKLASMLGAMVLSHDFYDMYYDKAMRIRRLIKDSLDFDKYDMIVLPASYTDAGAGAGADAFADKELALRVLPQLCGLPSVTLPYSVSGGAPSGGSAPGNGPAPGNGSAPSNGSKPGSGITFIADAGNETLLLSVSKAVQI